MSLSGNSTSTARLRTRSFVSLTRRVVIGEHEAVEQPIAGISNHLNNQASLTSQSIGAGCQLLDQVPMDERQVRSGHRS